MASAWPRVSRSAASSSSACLALSSSMHFCLSATSSWKIAIWMLFSSLASASICRSCSISSMRSSCCRGSAPNSCWPGLTCDEGGVVVRARSLLSTSSRADAALGPDGGPPSTLTRPPAAGFQGARLPPASRALLALGTFGMLWNAAPGADERACSPMGFPPWNVDSSGTSHSPKSIKFTTLSGFGALPLCGFLIGAMSSSFAANIRNPMSLSESTSSIGVVSSWVSSKNQLSSTAWVAFFFASAFARAFSFAAISFCVFSAATICFF
mmetsp:Transcript_114760/g.325058  ORF Transcript_114760/g.325058 Transcript_114760/m.325058 type:complete len:268 (-) Transcript_114760:245-1048(-)